MKWKDEKISWVKCWLSMHGVDGCVRWNLMRDPMR